MGTVAGGLFTGLDIALSGLQAQQDVMAVTAHNIANAGNPDYSNQEITLSPNPPYSPPSIQQSPGAGQYGMGVTVSSVQRQVSQFLQLQGWANDGAIGAGNQQSQALSQTQALLNEPSANGLNSALDQFWSAWQALGNDPGNEAARSQVVSQAQALGADFQTLHQGIAGLQQSLDGSLTSLVGQVNQLSGQIASLNAQIGAVVASGQSPNDLADTRDQLIGQLAGLLPVTVSWSADGQATVDSGGVNLVSGAQTIQMSAAPDPANHDFQTLSWKGNIPANITGGQIGAILQLRDQTLPGYSAQLDSLASGIATQVNALHATGSDGNGSPVAGTPHQDFFTVPPGGVTAASLSVNPAIAANPMLLAAAANPSGGPADATVANAIAALANQPIIAGATPGDAYATLVGAIGSDTAAAQSSLANQQALQQSISTQQQQVSGVSVDQQMVAMVTAQNDYAAAAKVTSTINTMLGDLITMVQ